MNRRQLLVALPAIVPCIGASSTPTVIQGLFAEWQAARATSYSDDEDVSNAANDRMCELEDRIISTPATCAADLAAKIASCTFYGDFGLPKEGDSPEFWEEIRRLTTTWQVA